MSWERARQPKQKAERREAILSAAADCFDEGGLATATLSAIAEGAGLSKGNLYRYFDSRDVILLELLLRETAGWADHIEVALGAVAGSNDPQVVATVIRDSLVDRPRLCALLAVSTAVLEQQMPPERIVDFKRRITDGMDRGTQAIATAMPSLSHAQAFRVVRYANLLLGQLWVVAHPAPALAETLSRSEFANRRVDFGAALLDVVAMMLRGLLAEKAE